MCQIWLEILRQRLLQMIRSVTTVSVQTWLRTPFPDFSENFFFFPWTQEFLAALIHSTLSPGPFESAVKASNQALAKLQIWECHTADPAGSVLSSMSIPLHMHLWRVVRRHHWPWIDTRVHLFTSLLDHALPCPQDCFAWLHTYNCSGAGVQPVCGVRAKLILFPPPPLLQRELWTSWVHARQNCCLPEPLCNAWKDHVYLLFGGALKPAQAALMETSVARVERNCSVDRTEQLN